MRTLSRCGGRVTPFFLRALLLDGKTVCGACKRAVYLCFLGCAEMRRPLLTELSAAGLLGVAVDKVTRCVAIPTLPAVWEWRRQVGVSCAAKSSVSFLLCEKGLLYMGFAKYSSPFYVYNLSVIASAGQQKACPPRDCFCRKPARQFSFSFAHLP